MKVTIPKYLAYFVLGFIIYHVIYSVYKKDTLIFTLELSKAGVYVRNGTIIGLLWILKQILEDNVPQLGVTDNQLLIMIAVIIIFMFITNR